MVQENTIMVHKQILRSDAAMHADGSHMAGLIGEPEAPPFALDLPQVLGGEHELFHARVRIAGPDVDKATGIGKRQNAHGRQEEQSPHDRTPSAMARQALSRRFRI
jgi:hypothetical protein